MQRLFFSIKINGYWWLKLLDNSFSLISMLCLLSLMLSLVLVQVHNFAWPFGVPHSALVRWEVYKARRFCTPLEQYTRLIHHNEWFEHLVSAVKMITYLRTSSSSLSLMPARHLITSVSNRKMGFLGFFLSNNSCRSIRRCHIPNLTQGSSTSAWSRLGGRESKPAQSHLTRLSLLVVENAASGLPGGPRPFSHKAGGECSPRDKPRSILPWPGGHEPGPSPGGNTNVKWPTHSSKQVKPPFLSSQEALLHFTKGYFSLEKREIKPVTSLRTLKKIIIIRVKFILH